MRAFLALLEARGAGELPQAELARALAEDGAATRTALVAAGVVRAAPLATTYPCEGLGCARDVRERARAADGARRFLAVCTESPRACETLELGEAELAQEAIVLDAFVDAVRRALRIAAPLGAHPAGARATDRALAGADAPLLLGEQLEGGHARDVFLARRPSAPQLRTLLAERRAAPRPALVLVLTARGIDPELLARHGPGHVEIAALSDRLAVQRGKIVAAPRLRVVPEAQREAAAPAPANDARASGPKAKSVAHRLPRATRWNEVTFYSVEDERSIGVEIDGRACVFTASELGLAIDRTGEPVRAFTLLRRICDGNGVFDTRPWGSRDNGKQIVSELRRALSAALEIAASPIESYSKHTKSWKPRFRAFAAPPAMVREMERELLGLGRGKRRDDE